MPIVSSYGAVQSVRATATLTGGGGSVSMYGRTQTYGAIYRAQPNVRTVVDFLARNIAQLGLHAFRRIDDNDRERLADHEVIQWVQEPNPSTTDFRLIESLMCDLGVYFNAYWLKVRLPDRIGLMRLPPDQMQVKGTLMPDAFVWTNPDGDNREFSPTEVVHYCGYDPLNALGGVSPLETLRRTLAEESAAGEYRQQLWSNAARFEGIVERPAAAKKWTADQGKSWRSQWQEQFARGGVKAGSVAVLEDGMQFKAASWNSKDLEYLSARKLSREECAAAYHVPLPMVGILEHATFSNIKEQHKHLYQDCLGPWLKMITAEIKRQLLPEAIDQDRVYLEFNIAEKLKGSFEEQAASLQAAVGRPWMTVNEARARMNYPRLEDPAADQIAPQQGGPAQPPPAPPAAEPSDDSASSDAIAAVVQSHQVRQLARLSKHDAIGRPDAFSAARARWARELATDLTPLVGSDSATRYAEFAIATMLARLRAEAAHAA